MNEVLIEAEGNLDNTKSQLPLLRQVVDKHTLEEARDDRVYYHAVFADELMALTIAGTQMELFLQAWTMQGDSSNAALWLSHSDSNSSDSEPFTGLLSSNDTIE